METTTQFQALEKSTLQPQRQVICQLADLVAGSGICVLVNNIQIAVFYLPDETPALYALANWDPLGEAHVISRGIVGDINGDLVVASPLYKQHFRLTDGRCLEVEGIELPTFAIEFDGNDVCLSC